MSRNLSLLERRLVSDIAAGVSLSEVFDELLRSIEACSGMEMLGSILLLDKQGRHLQHCAAPSLPQAYNDAINQAEIGPAAGSCGTAVFRGEPVYVADIANDPLWTNYRDLALTHGLQACWSTPIRAADARILGTFAAYYREPRSPTEQELETIALISQTVALAIERHLSEQAGRESQERMSHALNAAGLVGTWDWHSQSNIFHCDARLAALLSLDPRKFEDGAPLTDFPSAVHPEDIGRTKAAIERAFATGEKFSQECRLIQRDGSVRWVFASGECGYDADGKPLRFAGAVVDITCRKVAEEVLRKTTHRLEAFNRFSKTISSDLDLERIVQTVTDIATELSGAKFGAFFYNVLDDNGEQYLLYTLSGAPREAFGHLGLPRNTALFEPTFRGIGVVRSPDIRADPRYGKHEPHYGMPKGHLPVVSYLAVPVISQSGDVHGGLFFAHDKQAAFTKESEEIVTGIAAHAAIAIDNARLHQAAQTEIAERRRVEQSTRRQAEAALRESEARLQEALMAGQVSAFEWDPLTRLTQYSANAAQVLGFQAGELNNDRFLNCVHSDDRARFRAHVLGVSPHNPSFLVSFRFIRPDGQQMWLEQTARAEFDATGRYVRLKGLIRDITERKRSEEHRELLVAELDHRVKNVLASVSAVAQRTREGSGSIDEFLQAFDGRIQSMANAHALLSRSHWTGVGLAELVRNELESCFREGGAQVEGPDVLLSAEATQPIAIVLHELVANASKYGALSVPDGHITVRWDCQKGEDSGVRLLLEWIETGGPPVVAPSRTGYGTRAIRSLVPYELGGAVELFFDATGVRCRIEIPSVRGSTTGPLQDIRLRPMARCTVVSRASGVNGL